MAALEVPDAFLRVQYVAARIPGVPDPENLAAGANCQLFAYQLLKHFGRTLPDFRSSELWDDDIHTARVTTLEPLDLLLHNARPKAWGAHVSVYLGDDRVVHLSREIGTPVTWRQADFAAHARYAFYIGAKRVVDRSGG